METETKAGKVAELVLRPFAMTWDTWYYGVECSEVWKW